MDICVEHEALHQAEYAMQKYSIIMQHDLLSRLGVPPMGDEDDTWRLNAHTARLYKRIKWAQKRLEAIEYLRTP